MNVLEQSGALEKTLLLSLSLATLLMMGLLSVYGPAGGFHGLQWRAFKELPPKVPEADQPAWRFGLMLDFVFLLLYPTTLSLACAMAAKANVDSRFWHDTGRVLSLLILSAIPLDILDNMTVLLFLKDKAGRGALIVGGLCASWDIALFSVCALFAIAALVRHLMG